MRWLEGDGRGLGTGGGLLALGVVGVLGAVEVGRVLVLLSALFRAAAVAHPKKAMVAVMISRSLILGETRGGKSWWDGR